MRLQKDQNPAGARSSTSCRGQSPGPVVARVPAYHRSWPCAELQSPRSERPVSAQRHGPRRSHAPHAAPRLPQPQQLLPGERLPLALPPPSVQPLPPRVMNAPPRNRSPPAAAFAPLRSPGEKRSPPPSQPPRPPPAPEAPVPAPAPPRDGATAPCTPCAKPKNRGTSRREDLPMSKERLHLPASLLTQLRPPYPCCEISLFLALSPCAPCCSSLELQTRRPENS